VAIELIRDSNCEYLMSDVYSGYGKTVKVVNDGYYTAGFITTPDPKLHSSHASVVMGRSWNPRGAKKKGCYFLIKNSWGSDWPGAGRLNGMHAIPAEGKPGYYYAHESDLGNRLKGLVDYERR
jgi:hypothetical protein